MTLDLTSAFGESAMARLRGLLPPRFPPAMSESVPEPVPDSVPTDVPPVPLIPLAAPLVPAPRAGETTDVSDSSDFRGAVPAAPSISSAGTSPILASTTNRRWGMTRVVSREHSDLLVLCALRHGPDHAPGIIKRLRDESGGLFEAPDRTVHRTLHRLTRNRLLRRVVPGPRGGPRYRLTEAGERAVRARARQWRAFARAMDAVVGRGDTS